MAAEPRIVINGVALTDAEAMTVRVAVERLVRDMQRDGLGDDDTGRAIAAGYVEHGRGLSALLASRR